MSRAATRVDGIPVRRADIGGGRQLAYLSVGSGPTVLLVPGYTGSKEDFGPLLLPLAAAGMRAVALDQRGQLDSPGDGPPESYTPDGLAADLLAFVDALDLAPVHAVGHSYGGLVVRAAVIARPTTFCTVTLLSSGPAAIGGARARLMTTLRPELVAGGVDRVAALLPTTGDDAFEKHRFTRSDRTGLLGMGDALLAAGDRVDELAGTLARYRIPALVACGSGDDAWPPAVQEAMAARLGASFALLKGARHSPAVENPVTTAATLTAFLRSAPGGGTTPLNARTGGRAPA